MYEQNVQPDIIPSNSSAHTDFDFLQGRWIIRNRKLQTRLSNSNNWEEFNAIGEMHKMLDGWGNTDSFITTQNDEVFEGRTFRLFNPKTRLWSIYWADSINVTMDTPVIGSFDGNCGEFFAHDHHNGVPVLVKFNWNKTDPRSPVWSQAFSIDNGVNWEWNWYMYFSREA